MNTNAAPEASMLPPWEGRWRPLGLWLAALPFLLVRFVPATDLPQHLAQLRLLEEMLSWAPPTIDLANLELRLLAPNTLVYWILLPFHLLFSAPVAGKLGVLAFALGFVWGLHHLARATGRSGFCALLAGTLFFSHPTYWGFLNFVAGAPVFFWLLSHGPLRPLRSVQREALAFALCLVALAWAHVFWAGLAVGLVLVETLCQRSFRRFALYLSATAPVAASLFVWTKRLAAARTQGGFNIGLVYGEPLSERLTLAWFSRSLFGGIQGWFEPAIGCCVLAYLALGALQAFRTRGRDLHFPLLRAGAILCLFALFAPAVYMNSIFVNTRFMPFGVALLLLALPAPERPPARIAGAVFALLFALYTSWIWLRFDREEMSGMRAALALAREPKSVLGLNFRPTSPLVQGVPFLQTFAYFQAERGGEINFSFAEHGTGVVVYKSPRRLTWTPALEWQPERVTASDLAQFDCALINAPLERHAAIAREGVLKTSQQEGYFRLYCR